MPAPSASIHLGVPTPYITSHGSKIARLHMYDWIVLVLLVVVDGILNIIEPFHRFVGSDMMTDLRYPMKDNTVPFWAVPIIGIIGPMIIITGIYFKKRNVYDFHHAILGLLFSVLITAVITDAIKDGAYDNFTTGVLCHGKASVIKEGHKSFPSGHTSWSFAGLGFLSWYLAALVAVSRVDDYWHHWQDVFTGGILGLVVSSFCYLQFFPMPSDENGLWPHAYARHILNPDQLENNAQPTSLDRPNSLPNGSFRSSNGLEMGNTGQGQALDFMEAGRIYQ
uniref:Phosphatidic acid phosphatase type 2/haloperoxidase domain-containing protein n=1 Tax=Oryza meridionalis TaxID=40149 RepID=A0A0E0C6G6_9ORYZ